VLDALDTAVDVLRALRSRQRDLRLCVGRSEDGNEDVVEAELTGDGCSIRRSTSSQLLELLGGTSGVG
jgi:hypothetical protein